MTISLLLLIAVAFWLLLVAKVNWKFRALMSVLLLICFVATLNQVAIESIPYTDIIK